MRQVSITGRRWFSIARFLILTHVLVGVILTVWNLPAAYQNLRDLIPGIGFQGWTPEQLQAAAKASGITPAAIATPLFLVSLVCLLSFWVVAAVLAWRKSDSWINLLVIYILAGTAPGFSFLGTNVSETGTSFLASYLNISVALIWPSFFVLLYLFPDGRIIPRWTRFLAPLPYLAFFLGFRIDPQNFIVSLLQWLLILYAIGGIASQIYRFRRVSTPTQRQQTKWVVYALGVLVAGIVSTQAFPLFDPELKIGTSSRFLYDLFGNYVYGAIMSALIPLSIGISILRYRLWDIDLIIRRTLLYGLLSGLLGLVYFGSVLFLRQVLGGLAGDSSAALVISTLLIAALFSPLRRRLQSGIDRRFYRQKYDAARSLEGFSASVRNEVALEALTGSLAAVVTAAIQPQSISLWIKDRARNLPDLPKRVGDR